MTAPTPAPKRGLLIVVEGLDRAGKSSQCTRLVDAFSRAGQKACYVKFPGLYTPSLSISTPVCYLYSSLTLYSAPLQTAQRPPAT
jgi:hypothetical protein